MSNHGKSLEEDLKLLAQQTFSRRRAMFWLATTGAALPLIACGSSSSSDRAASGTTETTTGTGSSTASGGTTADLCEVIPEETEGPYPGDGSNGKNVLTQSGIVRSDIRSSIGSASGVAEGVPLTIELTLLNASSSCNPLSSFVVYIWHCDRDGNYSMYSSAVVNENYLRGVQEADDSGKLVFESIFPGCYAGRWPHIHFEVYESLDTATSSRNKIATSQIALPAAACNEAYATTGYSTSVKNLSRITLASDGIFSDSVALQMPSIEGNASDGFKIALTVAVKA